MGTAPVGSTSSANTWLSEKVNFYDDYLFFSFENKTKAIHSYNFVPIKSSLTWLMTPAKCWHTLALSSSAQCAVG